MVRGPYGTSLWKGIIRHLDIYQKRIVYEIGNGNRVFLGRIGGMGADL